MPAISVYGIICNRIKNERYPSEFLQVFLQLLVN